MAGTIFYHGMNHVVLPGNYFHHDLTKVRGNDGSQFCPVVLDQEVQSEKSEPYKLLLLLGILSDSPWACTFAWISPEHVTWFRTTILDGVKEGELSEPWSEVAVLLSGRDLNLPVCVNYDVNYSNLIRMISTGKRRSVNKAINWLGYYAEIFRIGPDNLSWPRFGAFKKNK